MQCYILYKSKTVKFFRRSTYLILYILGLLNRRCSGEKLRESSRVKLLHFLFFRYANLFLNLFSLMVDASVPDIALEPDKAVKKVEFVRI